jgi:2,4-diketo-3-deoxy-L-fuconate hydrolase
MRFANVGGRLNLVIADQYVDLEKASDGVIAADPQAIFEHWETALGWIGERDLAEYARPLDGPLGAPVPRPRQVFAMSLNYIAHADESPFAIDPVFEAFTKFPSCIAGPGDEIPIAGERIDHEVELVFVIGKRAHNVSEADAWKHVAGLMVGQDISDRSALTPEVFKPGRPFHQLSLGKSSPAFGPTGPVLVTPDELDAPTDLSIQCWVNGDLKQSARTSAMTFPIPVMLSRLSRHVALLPGDLCFTGTPDGVGMLADPPRFLRPGDVVRSAIEGLGVIENTITAVQS